MGYVLSGVLARADALPSEMRRRPTAALRQGIVLLPMTHELHDELTGVHSYHPAGAFLRHAHFAAALSTWSCEGPLAYVDAEFFGGIGFQHARVWSAGGLVLGPIDTEPGRNVPGGTPISQALMALGVVKGEHGDEFDAVGLGRHRETDDWLTPR